MMIKGVFGNSHKGAQSASEMTLVLGSASVALVQDLTPVPRGRIQCSPLLLMGQIFVPLYPAHV